MHFKISNLILICIHPTVAECDLIWNIDCLLVYFSSVHMWNSNRAACRQGDHSGAQNVPNSQLSMWQINQSAIDVSNEVTLGLRLDDCNIQIKFKSLKWITHSVHSKSKLFWNTRQHTLTMLTVSVLLSCLFQCLSFFVSFLFLLGCQIKRKVLKQTYKLKV